MPVQVTIGPWTDRGFFYDFDMPQPLTERDLPKIRKEMQRILKKNLPFVREDVLAEEARRRIQASYYACPAQRSTPLRVPVSQLQVGGSPSSRTQYPAALYRRLASPTSWRSWTPFWKGTPRPPSPSTT